MGKKHRKRKDSDLSISYFEQSSRDSSFNSLDVSNFSINEESDVPENFVVSSVESAKCSKYAECLRSDWTDVVFLHPSVMRSYKIEDLVLIKGKDRTVLCTAHPLDALRKNFIVFPKGYCPFKYKDLVSLSKYGGKVKGADEIFITFEEENCMENRDEHVLKLICNGYIYEGLIVKWKLFDKEYSCIIKTISCLPDISSLSLEPSKNPDALEFYKTTYKTVLKRKMQYVDKFPKLDDIGGLEKQVKLIHRYMEMFLKPLSCTRSVFCGTLLFAGPSGTGKSLLLQAVVNSYDIFTENINWYQLCAMSVPEVRRELKNIFQKAKERSPSIIVIDDFNYLCPNNAGHINDCISKTLSQLLETLDDTKVMIIAASNDTNYDASVLQTSRRIMETIKFSIPLVNDRIDILKRLLSSRKHEITFEQIQECAELAHGFTGKDLYEAIKDAQMIACKREFSDVLDTTEFFTVLRSQDNIGTITYHDFKYCLKLRKPSIVTSNLKIKKVCWSDIGGMIGVKEKLKQLVEWPLKYPDAYKHFNITPSRGVLMYGPPGCSKTMIAKALATECELNFISKNAADLFDKYVGESEKSVRDLFALAKAKSPCIIFLDEIDALVMERGSSSGSSGVGDRIVTTLLTEMDGIEELQGVVIIAATNRPDMLDDALVRNGRISHFIYVPLPDAETREEILKISMKNRVLCDAFDFKVLTEKTEGFSGAEIVNLCNEAALQLLAEDPKAKCPIFRLHHFESALKFVLPRTNKKMIDFYESFNEKHCTK